MAGSGSSSCNSAGPGRRGDRLPCALRSRAALAHGAKRVWAAALLLPGLFIVAGSAGAQTSLFLTDAPAWTHYLCDSSEPDPDRTTARQGAHCFASLTVPRGSILTVTNLLSGAGTPQDSPRGVLLAFVDGTCTIGGTIDASASNTGYSNGGGSGGGGGGAATLNAGQGGLRSMVFGSLSDLAVAAGGAGGRPALSGGPGATPTAATQKWIWNTGQAFGVLGGSIGGTGGVGTGSAAAGGSGGGGVALICATINFTGTVKVNGGAGAGGKQSGGGGGGGGGGVVIMAARTYTSNTGVVVSSGGAGGRGDGTAGAGGPGGAGWLKQFTLQ